MTTDAIAAPAVVFERADFDTLLGTLRARGFTPVGPTRRDGAIVYDEIAAAGDLPIGWTDVQEGGRYRLERRGDEALFGYNVGPHSWKKYLLPPRLRLWRAERQESGFVVLPESDPPTKLALIGVRACELHAIGIQDRVLVEGPHRDVHYAARRSDVVCIAVNCGQAGATCFCVSMGTGPRCGGGADLTLTELLDVGSHRFLAAPGSPVGSALLAGVPHRPATRDDLDAAERTIERAAAQMGRVLDRAAVEIGLRRHLDSPHWEQVAQRCLGCANCTLVCPTCFCTQVEDVTDLRGESAEHVRTWDSCFDLRFSYMNGGAVRTTLASRYRQWLTHKLSTWTEQFGTQGCVGCGRCITWCPVGIDLTAEARAVVAGGASERRRRPHGEVDRGEPGTSAAPAPLPAGNAT